MERKFLDVESTQVAAEYERAAEQLEDAVEDPICKVPVSVQVEESKERVGPIENAMPGRSGENAETVAEMHEREVETK